MPTLKIREDRARRALSRGGYILRKTPARSSLREVYGAGYLILHARTNCIVSGGTPYAYSDTIDDVERFALAPEMGHAAPAGC